MTDILSHFGWNGMLMNALVLLKRRSKITSVQLHDGKASGWMVIFNAVMI